MDENAKPAPAPLTPKQLGSAIEDAVYVLHRIRGLATAALDDHHDAGLYSAAIIDITTLHGKRLDDLLPRTTQLIATGYFDSDEPEVANE
jgi:hypothetical protein